MVEIIEDRGGLMSIKVSEELLQLFKRLRWFHSLGQPERLSVGRILHLRDGARLSPYVGFYKGDQLPEFGSFSYSSSPLDRRVSIGAYSSISWDVRVMGGSHPLSHFSTTAGLYSNLAMFKAAYDDAGVQMRPLPNPQKPLPMIGNDVWIGQNVLLGLGVNIADGAVVAAGSVVVKDVPPYQIVGGTPAKFIRYRFNETEQASLQKSRWWTYHLPSLTAKPTENIPDFIAAFEDAVVNQKLNRVVRFSESLTDIIRSGQVSTFLAEDGRKMFEPATAVDVVEA